MAAGDEDNDGPLDPAVERVRRKMLRMLVVSMAVTFLGLMAVVTAVVYRARDRAPVPVAAGEAVPLRLGEGRTVADMALDGSGDRALLRLAGPSGEELIVLDIASGTVVGRFRLEP